jgi:hypothetical protein
MWKIVLSITLLTGLIVGLYYLFSGEEKRELNKLMQQLARTTVTDFTARIDRERDVDTVLLIVAGRGHRDEEEQFRDMLIDAVTASDKYRVRTWEYVQDSLDDSLLTTFLQKVGMVPGQEPTSYKRSVEVLQLLQTANIDMDGLLFVDVTDFTEGSKTDALGARIALEGKVYSLKRDAVVSEIGPVKHAIESAWDIRYVRHQLEETSWLLRFLGWFVVAAGLPWAFIEVVRGLVKKRKNALNLALLAAFTVFDVLAAWVLLGALGTSFGALLPCLLALVVMGYYNYDACDYIERRLL